MASSARPERNAPIASESTSLQIRPVVTRAELSNFISLPRRLYAGLPGYEAPLDFERREMLDPRKSKFFEHAEVQYFLACRGERAVGRISAQVDRLAIETWGENIGCFGCLDAIDDAAVVAALCEAAAAWLRERGMARMRGPFTLSINGESGLQTSGQELGGMVLMPWHPPYLAGHVEAAGLTPTKELLAFTLNAEAYKSLQERASLAKSRLPESLVLRKIDLKNLRSEGEILRTVFNEAWKDNWSFVPITESEMTAFTKGFKPFLIPELGLIAEVDGHAVAMAVVLPNLFDVMRNFGGRLLPFNWIKFLLRGFRVSSYHSVRVVLFGIVPQLQRIGAPVVFAMLEELFQRQQARLRFATIEMSWVLEDNRPVINLLRAVGVSEPSKRYRMYEREIIA